MPEIEKSGFLENDIRPQQLMGTVSELFQEDIVRLMAGKERFVTVPCPACVSQNADLVYEKNGQLYERCAQCQTVFVNPRPTPEQLAEHYRSARYYQYWNDVIFPSSEDVRRKKIFRPRAKRIAELLDRNGIQARTLLEVGAGFGTFCEEAEKLNRFDRVIAIEPTPSLAESCRKRGLEVIEQPVEEVDLASKSVDVVVSFEVIEHLFSPREFVGHCARLLAPGGLLVLTCPNVRGFDIVVLGALSDSVDPEHLNYLHPDSLSLLVQQQGFEVLELLTPGRLDAELVRKKALAGDFSLEGHPFLRQVLREQWDRVGAAFQSFLANNCLSSHLWLAARKRPDTTVMTGAATTA